MEVAVTNLEAALDYASRGIPVFPLKPRSKKPATEHGFKDATTDPEQIRAWWGSSPNANVAFTNGSASGLWVLDIDPRNDSNDSWKRLIDQHGEPLTRTIRTGSGGRHYVFTVGERSIKRRKTRYPGIEVCGEGGYVVAPPSVTESGPYEVLNDIDPQPAEPWVLQIALESPETLKVPVGSVIPEGSRDTTLYRIACHYRGRGCEEFEILEHLERENAERCSPPLEHFELERIARSAARLPLGVSPARSTPPYDPHPGASLPSPDEVLPFVEIDLWDRQANGIPPLDWLIPDWLVAKDTCIIGGDAGVGKSTTAAVLARALASGEPWLGIRPTRRSPVLYFDEEQGEEMVTRLFLQIGGPVAGLRVYSGQGINLSDPHSVERLKRSILEIPVPPVVFLDTVQQTFGVDDANSATKVGAIYGRTLFRLRDQTGATFVLLHHISKPPKEEGFRGRMAIHRLRDSSVHGTQASTVWFLQPAEPGSVDMFQVKRRGSDRKSMMVRYSRDGDERIVLEGEDAMAAMTSAEALAEAIAEYVHSRSRASTGELVEIALGMQLSKRLATDTIGRLVREKAIFKIGRGTYAPEPPVESAQLLS